MGAHGERREYASRPGNFGSPATPASVWRRKGTLSGSVPAHLVHISPSGFSVRKVLAEIARQVRQRPVVRHRPIPWAGERMNLAAVEDEDVLDEPRGRVRLAVR